jgi:purine-nucleoside/S-methyl-5'-thioadenosine phosphorylase / adenosine deaminase
VADRLPLLTSPVIPAPFRHGFTTRAGGVSAPPFDTLNLGLKWGDAPASVLENRGRVLRATGASVAHNAAQVHGARVLPIGAGDDPARTADEKADALCSDAPGIALYAYVADCVPVLLADPRTRAFAAVHAGWRGTVAGVLAATVTTMARLYGTRPADLRAALGPAIGPCCFEVGPEVVAAFTAALPRGGGVILDHPGARPHIDLRHAQRLQLEATGVAAESIDILPACTKCDPARRFFSYRADAGRTGMQIGFVSRAG